MLQPGGDPDLAEEPLGSERGGELGAQHLERHGPIVPEVVGEVDRGHAAAAELALDAVAIGQGVGKSGVECAHSFCGLGNRNVAGPAADYQQSR